MNLELKCQICLRPEICHSYYQECMITKGRTLSSRDFLNFRKSNIEELKKLLIRCLINNQPDWEREQFNIMINEFKETLQSISLLIEDV